MGTRKPIMITLVILIGLSIFIQEIINIEQSLNKIQSINKKEEKNQSLLEFTETLFLLPRAYKNLIFSVILKRGTDNKPIISSIQSINNKETSKNDSKK